MNFSRWSLYAKIYLMVGMLVIAGGLTTAISISGITEVTGRMKEMSEVHNEVRALANNILDAQRVMLIANRNLILRTEEKDMKKVAEEFNQANQLQDDLIAKLDSLGDENQRKMAKTLAETKIKWLGVVKGFQVLASQNKNQEATAILYGEAASLTQEMAGIIDDIKADAVKQAKEEMQDSLLDAARAKSLSYTIGGASLFVVALFVFFMVRSLKASIQKVVDDLSSAAQQIAAASTQVASSSEELSQSVTEQASSLEQTAASIEEISSMVKKSTENAQLSAETSVSAQQKAFDGKKTVERMLTSMNEIDESNSEIMRQTEESNRQTADILKVIQEIGAKTKVINDIVFQTKLLSFNASVEAARAGEQGKGFAVVAEEVGNLAQMSGNAAKEISEMLDTSMRKVEGITRENKEKIDVLITRGKSKVQSGVDTARQCADVLDEIVQNVSRVSSMAGEISTANQEQSQGISEINKAVGQLDQVTQQNAATGSQTANAAEMMSTQVSLLKNTVDRLVATIEGASQAARSAEAPAPVLRTVPAPAEEAPENRRQARAS